MAAGMWRRTVVLALCVPVDRVEDARGLRRDGVTLAWHAFGIKYISRASVGANPRPVSFLGWPQSHQTQHSSYIKHTGKIHTNRKHTLRARSQGGLVVYIGDGTCRALWMECQLSPRRSVPRGRACGVSSSAGCVTEVHPCSPFGSP